MKGNLVIVESPAKAKKIQQILGDDYTVKSSYGHIRDLSEKALSIDVADNFRPEYLVSPDKKKLVAELRKDASSAQTVWLASDADREGEAISWHLYETLGLTPEKSRRITFLEITPEAIKESVKHPRDIDMNLVNAQQARRILDRLVGFELSPVLWKKIQSKLSAGRVQSVALRLVVDREREVMSFQNTAYWRVEGSFVEAGKSSGTAFKAVLDTRFDTADKARDFLSRSIGASYAVSGVKAKEGKRSPAPPFTTAELQQEASRKFGFSVSQTMQLAQSLYESGFITYMRTDSVNLSSLAINTAKSFICSNFGEKYSHPRQYRTKDKGAQEAHEAIRPTYIQNEFIKASPQEQKLYSLIWKRTVASQMEDAGVLNTTVEISSDRFLEKYLSETQTVLFDGFLKLYMESSDDDTEETTTASAPDISEGSVLCDRQISAECKFTAAPPRYTEASLVKKLKELRIGRPSTYAPTITTLTKARGYITKGNKEGRAVSVTNFKLEKGCISENTKVEKLGADKGKLLPSDIGMMVCDFLVQHFPNIMDYNFTADVEEDFDRIAEGQLQWNTAIGNFYSPFHEEVQKAVKESDYSHLERQIGIDPADGQMITARYGQYGPYVQKGEGPAKQCSSLAKGQNIEFLTLDEAVKLFLLPRTLGSKDGVDVIALKGRFGPYLKFGDRNVPLPKGVDPLSLSLQDAVAIIDSAATKPVAKVISAWGDIQVIEGNYGPYIKTASGNYRIPKGTDAAALTEADCKNIIESSQPTSRSRRFSRKK